MGYISWQFIERFRSCYKFRVECEWYRYMPRSYAKSVINGCKKKYFKSSRHEIHANNIEVFRLYVTVNAVAQHNTDQIRNTFFFPCGVAAQRKPWLPHSWGFKITHNDASKSVGLLWTNDQAVAETSTWQHTTLDTNRYPWTRQDSNPQSQQASSRRPTL